MNFRRPFLSRHTVDADGGGVIGNGPFRVKLRAFTLTYVEGQQKLTLPVELLTGKTADYNIGTNLIRHWDDSAEVFQASEKFTIENNIFAALDYMRIRYTNAR